MPRRHGGAGSLEYNTWLNIKARCHNQNHPRYPEWGGRGIRVCDSWRNSFPAFLKDMGPRPSDKHSIDRIDGSRGYEPGNCRWATRREQAENRPSFNNLITFNGKTQSLTAWSREVGISRESLRSRMESGWPVERALTEPRSPRFKNYVSVQVER